MKLYGFTKVMNFFCICYGTNAFFFNIKYGKKDKKFHLYKGYIISKEVVFYNRNTYPNWWFFGFIINDSSKSFIEYEEYYNE